MEKQPEMSGSSTAFSSDGAEVISRKIDPINPAMEADLQHQRDLRQYYEIERCSEFIKTHNFQKIALQFPDFLLPDAAKVSAELQREFAEKQFFILGDTSYGSCCVDEVAAEHSLADCIVHFGPSCLTQTKRLPVLYVFGTEDIDTEHCVVSFKTLFPSKADRILVLYDTVYSHCVDEFKGQIYHDYPNCIISSLQLPNQVRQLPPHKSHDSSETATGEARTPHPHLQSSSIELPTRELCCSSCGKAGGVGSCSSRRTAGVSSSSENKKEGVESGGEREGRSGQAQSSSEEGAEGPCNVSASEAEDTANEKKSNGDEAEGDVSSKFSNKDDVIAQGGRLGTNEERRCDDHSSGGGGVSKDMMVRDGDTTRTDVNSSILLQGSSSVETDTKVTSELQVHKHVRFGRSFELTSPIEEYKVFYIGVEGASLNNLMLNYNKCQFYSYNPVTRESRKESLSVNKALGQRYFLVQKAKEAKTVGILVGTLGAANYLAIIERLKQIVRDAGKKYYTVAVGKLNVPKMANFLEIDVYVLVACPENSLVDSHEFYKPVVTPFEMELACMRSRDWSGDFTTSFQDLLPGGVFHVSSDEGTTIKDEEPEYSLISGGLVFAKQSSQEVQGGSLSAVVQRSKMEVALENSAGAQFLHSRSWRGLEQNLGETEVSEPVEGRTGLPVSYSHEHKHNTTQ